MQQVITAAQLGSSLDRDGFVALDIPFDFGKATLKPEAQPLIAEMVNLLRGRAGMKVGIEGHTDNVGTPQANKALSLARAQSVVAALTAAGIDANRMAAAGFGQENPVADNRTEAGRAKNRRVEIVKK